jgi:heat-inducible transcriptional repressor
MADEHAPPTLTPRQEQILASVVEEYVSTGSPVGSKTLVLRGGLEVSSSTVRYELAVLEEQGLLMHPHTSAGRVPTDLGYRFYVDRVLVTPRLESKELGLDLGPARAEVDTALRTTAEALAHVTHLLALVSAPPLESTLVRHVEVISLQPQLVMVVVITSAGGVTKRLVSFDAALDGGLVEWGRQYLNESLAGQQLAARALRRTFEDPELSHRESEFLDALKPAFVDAMEDREQGLYIGGAAGLLDEFRGDELGGYRRLLEVLEERAALIELMRVDLGSKRPFARVGSEFDDPELRTVALVGAPYGLQHRNLGTVSLLGPTRMDYAKAIDSVRAAARELSRFVEDLYED